MRIENTYGFQPGRVDKKDAAGKTGKSGKSKPDAKVKQTAPEDLVSSEAQPWLEKLAALPDVRTDAVEAARQALANGELDTPDAAARAARNLLDGGL